jgi:hypothetical protein
MMAMTRPEVVFGFVWFILIRVGFGWVINARLGSVLVVIALAVFALPDFPSN